MWISKKKFMKLEERLTEAEQKIAKLDEEMHPSLQKQVDAFMEVIRFYQKNQTFRKIQNKQSSATDGNAESEKAQLKQPDALQ